MKLTQNCSKSPQDCSRYGSTGSQRRWAPLHPAVMEAVAVIPTTEHGQFDTKEFFPTVVRIARQKYAKAS